MEAEDGPLKILKKMWVWGKELHLKPQEVRN